MSKDQDGKMTVIVAGAALFTYLTCGSFIVALIAGALAASIYAHHLKEKEEDGE